MSKMQSDPVEDLRSAALWVETGSMGFAPEYANEILALEKRIQGTADALDSLRESVKPSGCKERAACPGGTVECGDGFDGGQRFLCDHHALKRDAAIRRLLGTTDNGGGDDR